MKLTPAEKGQDVQVGLAADATTLSIGRSLVSEEAAGEAVRCTHVLVSQDHSILCHSLSLVAMLVDEKARKRCVRRESTSDDSP